MPTYVACPHCDSKLKVVKYRFAKKVRCPGCEKPFAVPEDEDDDEMLGSDSNAKSIILWSLVAGLALIVVAGAAAGVALIVKRSKDSSTASADSSRKSDSSSSSQSNSGADPAAKAEMQLLKGVWNVLAVEKNGQVQRDWGPEKVTFEGEQITIDAGVVRNDRMRLHPETSPKQMDLIGDGYEFPGIYQIDGDNMLLCLNVAGSKQYPTTFTTSQGDGLVLRRMRRANSPQGSGTVPTGDLSAWEIPTTAPEWKPDPQILAQINVEQAFSKYRFRLAKGLVMNKEKSKTNDTRDEGLLLWQPDPALTPTFLITLFSKFDTAKEVTSPDTRVAFLMNQVKKSLQVTNEPVAGAKDQGKCNGLGWHRRYFKATDGTGGSWIVFFYLCKDGDRYIEILGAATEPNIAATAAMMEATALTLRKSP